MKNEARESRSDWVVGTALFVLALSYFARLVKHHSLTIYQGRDIQRTLELLGGNLPWFGPELTGGGNLPGPAYYWLLAIPLSIFGTWESLIYFEIVLASLTAVVFWYWGKKYYSEFCGLLIFFFYVNSPMGSLNLTHFWNPSYILIFQAAILFLLFEPYDKDRNRLVAGSVILGLSLQIHYMQVVFLFGLIAALWMTPKIRQAQRLQTSRFALVFTLIPLIPYLLWTVFGSGSVKTNSTAGGFEVFVDTYRQFFQQYGTLINRVVVGDLCVLLSLVAWPIALFMFRNKRELIPKSLFLGFSFLFSIPLLVSAGANFYNSRYSIPFFLTLYLISAPTVEWFESKYRKVFWGVLAAIGVGYIRSFITLESPAHFDFSLLLFLGAATVLIISLRGEGTRAFSIAALVLLTWFSAETWKRKPVNELKSLEIRVQLAEAIVSSTGWDYNYLRERTYLRGLELAEDFSAIYRQVYRLGEKKERALYDGILVSLGEFTFRDIPIEIYKAFKEGEISCTRTEYVQGFQICYYHFTNPRLKSKWNNLGSPYENRQPALFPISKEKGFHSTGSGSGYFYFNACEKFEAACTVYFEMHLLKDSLTVRVFGDPISVPHIVASTARAVHFKQLRLDYLCDGEKSLLFVASHLGYPEIIEGNSHAPFLLAPLERTFPIKCKTVSGLTLDNLSGVSATSIFDQKRVWTLEIKAE